MSSFVEKILNVFGDYMGGDDMEDQIIQTYGVDSYMDSYNDVEHINYTLEEKLDALLKAVSYLFDEDPSKPGVLLSYIGGGNYYISISRFNTKFGKNKRVIYNYTSSSIEDLINHTAKWILKQNNKNPINELKRVLKAV